MEYLAIKCDICGQETNNYVRLKGKEKLPLLGEYKRQFDICQNCQKEFRRWATNKIKSEAKDD